MRDRAVLEKIGISDKIVKNWRKKGLTITYPMVKNKKFYKSEDGDLFVETADKYVPHLSKKEINIYTQKPEDFRKDFLRNTNFFAIDFCDFISKNHEKANKLKAEEKIAGLLSLLYLFQRAMDHHYYHFDRYLAYQNYPDTPVGFWWERLRILCTKLDIDLLKLLANDKEELSKASKSKELKEALDKIKVFERVQEEEVKTIFDTKKKEHRFIRTGFPIWEKLYTAIKASPSSVKKNALPKVKKIMEGHPIYGTRDILSPQGLSYFNNAVFREFKNEIDRWTK